MPIYKFNASALVSVCTDVEADNYDDAKGIAEQRGVVFGPSEKSDQTKNYWVIDTLNDADVDDINEA